MHNRSAQNIGWLVDLYTLRTRIKPAKGQGGLAVASPQTTSPRAANAAVHIPLINRKKQRR